MCICAMLNRAFIEARLFRGQARVFYGGLTPEKYYWPGRQPSLNFRREQTELDTTQLFLKLYYNSCNYFVNHRKTSSSYSKMNFFVVENLHIMWKYPYLNPEIYNHNQLVKIYVLKVIRYKCVLLCLRNKVIFVRQFYTVALLSHCFKFISEYLKHGEIIAVRICL